MQDIAIPGIFPLNHHYLILCSSPALNHSTLRVREILHLVLSTAVKHPGPPELHTKRIRKQYWYKTFANSIKFAFLHVLVMYYKKRRCIMYVFESSILEIRL